MKVIFLDIDGVLNSREYDRKRDYTKQTDIDETRLKYVKDIVDATGAVIVLSSTWRVHWNSDRKKCDADGIYIIDTFARHGLSIYDKTPDLGYSADRPDEIKQYLTENDQTVEKFVIIDDYMYGWGELGDFFVKTEPYRDLGINEENVRRAIEILS